MALARTRGVVGGAIVVALMQLGTPALAADIGGWFAEQQQKAEAADTTNAEACPQVIARAAADTTGAAAYRAALCHLQGDAPDAAAAKAWLARAAELNHLPARRLLQALLRAEGTH